MCPDSVSDAGGVVDFHAVVGRVRRRLGVVILVTVSVMFVVAMWSLLAPRRYEAKTVLSAVGPAQTSIGGAATSFLLDGQISLGGAGIQATPALVSYLLGSESVLDGVARQTYSEGTVSEALFGTPAAELGRAAVVRKMRTKIRVLQARQTNLITLTVRLRDSALTRAVVAGIVSDAQELFARVASAQAGQFRAAQEARVDSAFLDLTATEDELLRFTVGNRVVQSGSRLALERDRLTRKVAATQQAYLSAIADRESARARELEQTPALAVVEAVPSVLPWEERHAVMRTALAGLAVFVALTLSLLTYVLWVESAPPRP